MAESIPPWTETEPGPAEPVLGQASAEDHALDNPGDYPEHFVTVELVDGMLVRDCHGCSWNTSITEEQARRDRELRDPQADQRSRDAVELSKPAKDRAAHGFHGHGALSHAHEHGRMKHHHEGRLIVLDGIETPT